MSDRRTTAAQAPASYSCPACGAVLFGWSLARNASGGARIVLDQCERCGLAVTRAERAPDLAGEIAELRRDGELIWAPNRRSFQAGIGGAQWAALEPGRHRLHLSPASARLLLGGREIEVLAVRTPFTRRSYRAMIDTLVNAFTLNDNFAASAKAGLIPRRTTRQRLIYGLDRTVSLLAFVPAAIFAAPIEWLGCRLGRGGEMELHVRDAQADRDALR